MRERLSRPVDAASLAVFRIAFGLLMLYDAVRYMQLGFVRSSWITPAFHFTYPGFDWVRPLPGNGMYALFVALALLGACIAAGLLYRVVTPLFAVLFTWVFLIDQTTYLNHFYLIILLAFLLAAVPAHRLWSADARIFPSLRSDTVPAWSLWLIRFQVAIPYVYGGIAKLNADWLAGEPMRMWLAESTAFPLIGEWFTREWVVQMFVWGGILVDLLVVPFLLWKKTRRYAFAVSLAFHAFNAVLFNIGVFPWFMMAATTIFFEPGWPRRVVQAVFPPKRESAPASASPPRHLSSAGLAALAAYAAFQLLFPFRHLLYPGPVSWTEEGHNFSWHMKLRDKDGEGQFFVKDAKGRTVRIDPHDYLTKRQVVKMMDHPDMIVQFARLVAAEEAKRGKGPVEVRARIRMSLNGRRPQDFVDPDVNLAAAERSWRRKPWILPLTEPLRPPENR